MTNNDLIVDRISFFNSGNRTQTQKQMRLILHGRIQFLSFPLFLISNFILSIYRGILVGSSVRCVPNMSKAPFRIAPSSFQRDVRSGATEVCGVTNEILCNPKHSKMWTIFQNVNDVKRQTEGFRDRGTWTGQKKSPNNVERSIKCRARILQRNDGQNICIMRKQETK